MRQRNLVRVERVRPRVRLVVAERAAVGEPALGVEVDLRHVEVRALVEAATLVVAAEYRGAEALTIKGLFMRPLVAIGGPARARRASPQEQSERGQDEQDRAASPALACPELAATRRRGSKRDPRDRLGHVTAGVSR